MFLVLYRYFHEWAIFILYILIVVDNGIRVYIENPASSDIYLSDTICILWIAGYSNIGVRILVTYVRHTQWLVKVSIRVVVHINTCDFLGKIKCNVTVQGNKLKVSLLNHHSMPIKKIN